MCMSTPKVSTPTTKTEAPVNTVNMDAAESTTAARDSDRQRRLRALSRFQTMQGGAMQGAEAGTGKTKLGA